MERVITASAASEVSSYLFQDKQIKSKNLHYLKVTGEKTFENTRHPSAINCPIFFSSIPVTLDYLLRCGGNKIPLEHNQ
jgi:hypothetical protein